MHATMQETPLTVPGILRYASRVFGATPVTTLAEGTVERTTFRAIAARAGALAHALREELGVAVGDRVGTFMFNCSEHLEAMVAVPSMGAVFTPINRHLDSEQIAHTINHSGCEVVVADPRLAPRLGEVLHECPAVRAVAFTGEAAIDEPAGELPESVAGHSLEALLDGKRTDYPWLETDEKAAAALCYSTGTGGKPKGVAYSHRAICLQSLSLMAANSMGLSTRGPFLLAVPLYHSLSWGVPYAALVAGTPLVLANGDVSPEKLAAVIDYARPRAAHGVPVIWTQLLGYLREHPIEDMPLKEIFCGGSVVPPALIRAWEENHGVDVIQVWGMTETGVAATVARPPEDADSEAAWSYRTTQGRFSPLVGYRVVNHGEVLGRSEHNEGEIQIAGPHVAGFYLPSQGPAEDDPTDDGSRRFADDGWLRTGDVGSVTRDGFLAIQDRARDLISSGGEWISSVQLENFILADERVAEVAVIGYPDDTWGERPLAITVLRGDNEPTAQTAEGLRDELRAHLPGWMIPEYWTFVERIDQTSVNKYDKKDLRARLARGEFEIIALGPAPRRALDEDDDEQQ